MPHRETLEGIFNEKINTRREKKIQKCKVFYFALLNRRD